MVKSRITRSELGACVAAAEADAEAIAMVGIRSVRRGAENVESINVRFGYLYSVNPALID